MLKTNVRVVAATNVNMQEAISDGRFREDLYYRLNAVPIFIPPLRERKEDILLLFRKFATDFAEKYKMPVIKLTADAQTMLTNYYWRGNVRQLKNVTEQISVIEQNREITAERLREYLPEQRSSLPALFHQEHGEGQKTFSNEREILYQVLFDMKKDMAEMRKIIDELMHKEHTDAAPHYAQESVTAQPATVVPNIINVMPVGVQHQGNIIGHNQPVEDTEEYVGESLSLIDAEKEMIAKALERHNGKRKYAAKDLHISERTLYRKIKEYGLD